MSMHLQMTPHTDGHPASAQHRHRPLPCLSSASRRLKVSTSTRPICAPCAARLTPPSIRQATATRVTDIASEALSPLSLSGDGSSRRWTACCGFGCSDKMYASTRRERLIALAPTASHPDALFDSHLVTRMQSKARTSLGRRYTTNSMSSTIARGSTLTPAGRKIHATGGR